MAFFVPFLSNFPLFSGILFFFANDINAGSLSEYKEIILSTSNTESSATDKRLTLGLPHPVILAMELPSSSKAQTMQTFSLEVPQV